MTEMLKGIARSDGVAVAKAYLLFSQICPSKLLQLKIQMQRKLVWIFALEASQNELSVIRENAVASLGEEAAACI